MAKRGRPRLLADKRKRAKVLKHLREGGSRADAAASVGVGYQALLNETKRDKELAAQVEKAEVDGKLRLIGVLHTAANKDPKWAAWMLERKHWEEWGKRNPETVTKAQLETAVSAFVSGILCEIPKQYHDKVGQQIQRILDTRFN